MDGTLRLKQWAACAALACAVTIPALAGDLPSEQRQGAVAFRTGGIGADEAKAMQDAARRYPLALEFVARSGASRGGYLADIGVTISDGGGNDVLQTQSGPFLLVKLPPGRYTVTAMNGDTRRSQRIDVPAHGSKRVVFGW